MKAWSAGSGMARLSLMAAAVCWMGEVAHASPRDPPPVPEWMAMEEPSTADWLRRLPGRYELAGAITHQEYVEFDPLRDAAFDPGLGRGFGSVSGMEGVAIFEWALPVEGKLDCIAVADAPGLQCVMNVSWPELWNMQSGKAPLGGVSDLTPAMVLAGVNPADESIRFLLVDKRGLGHPSSLVLKGERAEASVPCVNLPGVQTCKQKFTLEARANRNLIFVTLSSEVRYLRRKLDRKQALEPPAAAARNPIDSPTPTLSVERANEWVEEFLVVSFSMKRDNLSAEPVK